MTSKFLPHLDSHPFIEEEKKSSNIFPTYIEVGFLFNLYQFNF